MDFPRVSGARARQNKCSGAEAQLKTGAGGSTVGNSTAESGRLNQSIAVGDRDRNNLLKVIRSSTLGEFYVTVGRRREHGLFRIGEEKG